MLQVRALPGVFEGAKASYRGWLSLQIFESGENVFQLRPDLVVDLDELPSHDTFHIDDDGGWMWHGPAFALIRIEESVAIDETVIRIRQEWVVGDDTVFHRDSIDHLLLVFPRIDRDREDFRCAFLFFG